MTNDENSMTKEARSPNGETVSCFVIWLSSFVLFVTPRRPAA
jgi:hypothetical protein